MSNIDEIRSGYKIKHEDFPNISLSQLNIYNYSIFETYTEKYKLKEKIEDTNKIINDGKIKDIKLIKECKTELDNIKKDMDNILKTVNEDQHTSWGVIYDLGEKYKNNDEIPEAEDIYKKISIAMIKENVEKLIKFEKKFILLNDSLIELNKKLNINF